MVADAQFCFHLGQGKFYFSVCEGSSHPPPSSQKGQGSCVQPRIWGAPSLVLGPHRLLAQKYMDRAGNLALTAVCYSWVWGPWWDWFPRAWCQGTLTGSPEHGANGSHTHSILKRCQSARLEATVPFFVSMNRHLSFFMLFHFSLNEEHKPPDGPHSDLCSTFHVA